MDAQQTVDMLLDLAEKLGIECRAAPLAGSGGAMALIKGKPVLFLDAEATPADQAHALGAALAKDDRLDDVFLVPQLRQFIDQCREQPT